jgi:hypothetical protein
VKGRGNRQTVLAASELFADFLKAPYGSDPVANSDTTRDEKCSESLADLSEVTSDKHCREEAAVLWNLLFHLKLISICDGYEIFW